MSCILIKKGELIYLLRVQFQYETEVAEKVFPFKRQEIDWEQEGRRQAFDGNLSASQKRRDQKQSESEGERKTI